MYTVCNEGMGVYVHVSTYVLSVLGTILYTYIRDKSVGITAIINQTTLLISLHGVCTPPSIASTTSLPRSVRYRALRLGERARRVKRQIYPVSAAGGKGRGRWAVNTRGANGFILRATRGGDGRVREVR